MGRPVNNPVLISTREKFRAVIQKDGLVDGLELEGTMAVLVQKEEDAYLRIQIEPSDNWGYCLEQSDNGGYCLRNCNNGGFGLRWHPRLDKALLSRESAVAMRDPLNLFPVGKSIDVARWMFQNIGLVAAPVPLTIKCRPSISGGNSVVNIEYEASKTVDLQNVVIQIPLPALRDSPRVRRGDCDWSGFIEFLVPAADPSTFFPIDVKFTATKGVVEFKVTGVTHRTDGRNVKFVAETQLVVDSLKVV